MENRCSYCGISTGDQLTCPLCGTRLVRVNLRRTLLWALVVEEYLVVMMLAMRFT